MRYDDTRSSRSYKDGSIELIVNVVETALTRDFGRFRISNSDTRRLQIDQLNQHQLHTTVDIYCSITSSILSPPILSLFLIHVRSCRIRCSRLSP